MENAACVLHQSEHTRILENMITTSIFFESKFGFGGCLFPPKILWNYVNIFQILGKRQY